MVEKKAEEPAVKLTEIVTQKANAFQLPDGSIVDVNELLVWIANQVYVIRKAV